MSAPNAGGQCTSCPHQSGSPCLLATIESYQTKETDMNEHTARATAAKHDHRTFDEFDVSKALRLPYTDDEMALIETATAQAIFDDQGLVNDEALTNMMYGYELDECGNRRMQVKILDDKRSSHSPPSCCSSSSANGLTATTSRSKQTFD